MIELTEIWKAYSATNVLKGLDLKAKEGEFISIRGKSGAGKTTLLKIVGLLEPPDRGEVTICNRNVSNLTDGEKSRMRLHNIGFVFQFFNLIPSLTIQENIELPLALAGKSGEERRKRSYELLEYFDLTGLADRFPSTLSGGERQRIAVIRALSNNPSIILADEPTSSIDDENSELLVRLLSTINRERNVTIVLTTTDLYGSLPSNQDYLLREGRIHPCHRT